MTLEDAIEACRRNRPGIALHLLRDLLSRDPANDELRRVFNETLLAVFADSRQAFAEGRLVDAAHAFAVVVDHGEPKEKLRADLDTTLKHLVRRGLDALERGDVPTARLAVAQALLIDPGYGPTLTALAFIERGHGGPEAALRQTLRALRLVPHAEHAATQRDVAVQRAGEALLEALRARRTAEATALVILLIRGDKEVARRVVPLLGGGNPLELERELLIWLGCRHQAVRRFQSALDCFAAASALRIDASSLRLEADARQHLALEHLLASLRTHCSAYLNDPVGHARSQTIFRSLDAMMVQGLGVENIDHWTRTQYWGSLIGWRALVDCAEALGRNPYDHPGEKTFPSASLPAAPRDGDRRVFDCCTFFNEAEILEIRLRELNDVVDGFVVVEATRTHAGDPKPLVFQDHRERFRPYLDKITYVVDDEMVEGFSWRREAHQRDYILKGLAGCRDDDLIVVSDVDEILRRDVVARLRRTDPAIDTVFTAELDLFFYRLDYRFARNWRSAGAAPYRLVRRIGANAVRYLALLEIGPVIREAGWHFSWMGDVDRFIAKMAAYAHQEHAAEYTAQAQRNIEDMRRFLTEGGPPPAGGPGNGMGEYETIPVDETYPILVREDRERFARMGWIG